MISEILDEYKDTDEQQKQLLISEFINRLWKSNLTYKTYKKYYTYIVKDELLNNDTELIDLFNKYSLIDFEVCRSFYDKQLSPFDYIRIHINNMYGYLTDKKVYLSKQYYQLLLTPKHEYFSAINKLKNGDLVNSSEIRERIEKAIIEANRIKYESMEKKLSMSWKEYKKLINLYIERLFNNYMPLEDYESKHGWEMRVNVDGWSEDNYIVKYFCKSLTGYLRNYVKSLEKKERKCKVCGTEINGGNRKIYCNACSKIHRNEYQKNLMRNKRNMLANRTYLSE